MPMYEYKCETCTLHFDAIHKFSEAPEQCGHCLETDSSKFKRQLGIPAAPRMGGMKTMSTRHTTSEYFGHKGKMGKEEYFPEERKAKAAELKKKQEGKGATVAVSKPLSK
tara:strand:+ start:132 stop:461 length:330 start_codon:yes stop_codon:yes gene_type:complete